MTVNIIIYVIKHYESWIYNNNCRVSFSFFSPGDQSSLRGEESRRSGQGEAACGGRAGGHDQEVPWCLRAAGPHQPGAAEEREVRIDFTICLSTSSRLLYKNTSFNTLLMDGGSEPAGTVLIPSHRLSGWTELFNSVMFSLDRTCSGRYLHQQEVSPPLREELYVSSECVSISLHLNFWTSLNTHFQLRWKSSPTSTLI